MTVIFRSSLWQATEDLRVVPELATVPELDTRSVVSVEDEPEEAAERSAGEPEPQVTHFYGALPQDRDPRDPPLTQHEKRFYRKQTQALVQFRYVRPRRDRVARRTV